MAIKCKVFLHDSKNIASADGDDAGKLAEDLQDWVTANHGTLDVTTQMNVTSTVIEGGTKIMTLVILDNS